MTWSKTADDRRKDARTYNGDYRRKRKRQLERVPVCELRLEGCTYHATQADHIYGAAADPDHNSLRSVCLSCHRKRTARDQGLGFRAGNGKGRTGNPAPKPPRTNWGDDPLPRPATRW